MTPTPMTSRFNKCRWSPLRRAMDAMAPGDVLTYARDPLLRGRGDYYSCIIHARRLREAYEGARTWQVRVLGDSQFTIKYHDTTPTS